MSPAPLWQRGRLCAVSCALTTPTVGSHLTDHSGVSRSQWSLLTSSVTLSCGCPSVDSWEGDGGLGEKKVAGMPRCPRTCLTLVCGSSPWLTLIIR